MLAPQINIVIPLYNEEEVFEKLVNRLQVLINKSSFTIEVIMIDDGSKDKTAKLMKQLSLHNSKFHSIILSRNFGHQLALTSGLSYVNATEAVLIIDGDLQDPPELLNEFYPYIAKGYDIIYAIRKARKESLIKQIAYKLFYRLLKKISYIEVPLDTGDFSLISRRAVDYLNSMTEESRFLRGMRSWIGFNQIGVEYEREERFAGKSKYSFKKLLSLAFNGIFNFSEFPIKFTFSIGFFAFGTSLIYFLTVLFKKIFLNSTPEGFTALLFTIIMFGGVQLLALGLIGEYVIRIFFQVKKRPLFIVKERIQNKQIVK